MILPHWPGPLWIPWRARDISSTRISAALLCDPSDPLLDAPSPARFPLDPLVSPMVSVQPDTCGPPTWPIRPHQWLPLPTCPVPLPGTSDELAISYTLDDERLSQIIRPYFYADSPSTREKDTAWGWSSTYGRYRYNRKSPMHRGPNLDWFLLLPLIVWIYQHSILPKHHAITPPEYPTSWQRRSHPTWRPGQDKSCCMDRHSIPGYSEELCPEWVHVHGSHWTPPWMHHHHRCTPVDSPP